MLFFKKNKQEGYEKRFVLTDVSTTVLLAFGHIFPSLKVDPNIC